MCCSLQRVHVAYKPIFLLLAVLDIFGEVVYNVDDDILQETPFQGVS